MPENPTLTSAPWASTKSIDPVDVDVPSPLSVLSPSLNNTQEIELVAISPSHSAQSDDTSENSYPKRPKPPLIPTLESYEDSVQKLNASFENVTIIE